MLHLAKLHLHLVLFLFYFRTRVFVLFFFFFFLYRYFGFLEHRYLVRVKVPFTPPPLVSFCFSTGLVRTFSLLFPLGIVVFLERRYNYLLLGKQCICKDTENRYVDAWTIVSVVVGCYLADP